MIHENIYYNLVAIQIGKLDGRFVFFFLSNFSILRHAGIFNDSSEQQEFVPF